MAVINPDLNLKSIAIKLQAELQECTPEEGLEGIQRVFKGILQGAELLWEAHLAKQTNAVLMQDNLRCTCGNKIRIKRSSDTVDVEAH